MHDGGEQVVAVTVGDVDGEGNIVVKELRAGDGILIVVGSQVNDKEPQNLALFADQIPGRRIRKIVVFANNGLYTAAGLIRDVGVSI